MLVMQFTSTLIFLFAIFSTVSSAPVHSDVDGDHDVASRCALGLHSHFREIGSDLKDIKPDYTKGPAQLVESLSKVTGLQAKIKEISRFSPEEYKLCDKLPLPEIWYFLLDPNQLKPGTNVTRTWRTNFEDAQTCVRSLEQEPLYPDPDIPPSKDQNFQSYYQSVLAKHPDLPERVNVLLLHVLASKSSLTDECLGLPMLLLPYVYPADATKTLEEACAQAMVARSPYVLPEYENYIRTNQQGSNSKKPSDIVHDLELKTEYYLNRAELKTICSDVEGVLQHALPKKMKQLLAGFQFRQSISSHSGRTKVTDPTTKHPRGFQE